MDSIKHIIRYPNKKSEDVDQSLKHIIRYPNKTSEDVDKSLARFGPFYVIKQQAVSATKKKAWQHVKKSTSNDKGAAKEIYAAAITRVEKEAKETYSEKITGFTSSEFRLMMVKDGCFFLQLAFLILERSEELGYPAMDPIFGRRLENKKDRKKWIESMFFVGNQIPVVVLKELVKEKFFQDVIAKGNWNHPPTSTLCEKVFYKLLFDLTHPERQKQPFYHLLHVLHTLVVGQEPLGRRLQEEDINYDLEANKNNIEDGHGRSVDHKVIFQYCATDLKKADIVIKKLRSTPSTGIRSIYFQNYYFRAYLYLPVLEVDENMEILFRNLKVYEKISQKNRQVSSYLRLMSNIIQTPQDARLLKNQGIIKGSDDDVEKLPGILRKLTSEDQVTLTHDFHILRRRIRDYTSPLVHYQSILNLVVFLTLLQAFFAVLAYFKPPKP